MTEAQLVEKMIAIGASNISFVVTPEKIQMNYSQKGFYKGCGTFCKTRNIEDVSESLWRLASRN